MSRERITCKARRTAEKRRRETGHRDQDPPRSAGRPPQDGAEARQTLPDADPRDSRTRHESCSLSILRVFVVKAGPIYHEDTKTRRIARFWLRLGYYAENPSQPGNGFPQHSFTGETQS